VTGNSPLPFPGPIQAGSRPWRGLGGDHRASWSSTNSARILARTRSRAATIVGPSVPRPDSIATLGSGPVLKARSVTSLGFVLPLDLAGRRPRSAGGLAGHLDRGLDLDDLDFAANTVANIGEGKSQKSGITVDEPTAAVLADRVADRPGRSGVRALPSGKGAAARGTPAPATSSTRPCFPQFTKKFRPEGRVVAPYFDNGSRKSKNQRKSEDAASCLSAGIYATRSDVTSFRQTLCADTRIHRVFSSFADRCILMDPGEIPVHSHFPAVSAGPQFQNPRRTHRAARGAPGSMRSWSQRLSQSIGPTQPFAGSFPGITLASRWGLSCYASTWPSPDDEPARVPVAATHSGVRDPRSSGSKAAA
jgi:hypothetical protein